MNKKVMIVIEEIGAQDSPIGKNIRMYLDGDVRGMGAEKSSIREAPAHFWGRIFFSICTERLRKEEMVIRKSPNPRFVDSTGFN